MELWMKLLLGALAAIAVWRFLPGVSRAMRETPRGSASDWLGLLVPIGVVVAFVILMIIVL